MEKELFPLTAAQKMIYNLTREYSEPEVTCLGACIAFQAELDFSLLEKCIQIEYGRYDCLRLRFTEPDGDGAVMQYIAADEKAVVPFVDLREMAMAEAMEEMKRWTRVPFARTDTQMCDFRLIAFEDECQEEYQGVYLRIDHMLADSCFIIALANDVMGIYCHFAFGTPLPGAVYPFRAAVLRDLEQAENPVRKAADEEFWRKITEMGEPVFTDIKGPGRLLESRKRHGNPLLRSADRQLKDCAEGQASFYLREEPASRFMAFCKENRFSMTNLLLMGLRTYLSKQNQGEEDISVRNYVSRRSSRIARLSGGSRVHCYPSRTVIRPDMSFLDGVHAIRKLQNNIYRHVDYDSEKVIQGILDYYHAPKDTIYESVALTYQPMPICMGNEILRGTPCRTMWFSNGIAIQPVYLTVMQNPSNSGLEFYLKYQAADYGYGDIKMMYEELVRILFMGVEHPQMAVGEMMGLL